MNVPWTSEHTGRQTVGAMANESSQGVGDTVITYVSLSHLSLWFNSCSADLDGVTAGRVGVYCYAFSPGYSSNELASQYTRASGEVRLPLTIIIIYYYYYYLILFKTQ